MLNSISKPNFRNRVTGSDGKGYVLTWHCVDHVNYKTNPRKRILGYGKIFSSVIKYPGKKWKSY